MKQLQTKDLTASLKNAPIGIKLLNICHTICNSLVNRTYKVEINKDFQRNFVFILVAKILKKNCNPNTGTIT